MRMADETTIDVELMDERPLAYKVQSIDTGKSGWVPKSKCELELGRDKVSGKLTLPEKIAIEKGFV